MPFHSTIDIHNNFFIENNLDKDYLICNCLDIREEEIKKYTGNKILFITESITTHKHYNHINNLVNNNYFDILIGCIDNNPENNKFKLPYYLFCDVPFPINNYIDKFNEINDYVKSITMEKLIEKKFTCLINSWDCPIQKTRTNIYNLLNKIDKITCPGKLFNNESNQNLNNIGKIKYINEFKFNICSENHDIDCPGYITEKIMDCCLAGAIPIYCGWLDEIDLKIFNKDRILYYKSNDEKSIENIFDKVNYLYNNPDKLLEYYQQPIFKDTAYSTIEELKKNVINLA